MAATALIRFTQLPATPLAGVALSGVSGVQVDIENGSSLDILSWKIDLVYVPPGSAVPTGALAMGNSNMPFASFTPDLVPGSYRVVLTVYAGINQTGQSNVDIRCFVVPDASGIVFPPYQDLPSKLPVVGSNLPGEKPDELNLNSQPYGWDGDGTEGLLLDFMRQASAQLGGGGGAAGWNLIPVAAEVLPGVAAMGDGFVSENGGGPYTVNLPPITAANVGQSILLMNAWGLSGELLAAPDAVAPQNPGVILVDGFFGVSYLLDQPGHLVVLTAIFVGPPANVYAWVAETESGATPMTSGVGDPNGMVDGPAGALFVQRADALSVLWINTSFGSGNTWTQVGAGGGYTDEEAQDAVGAMLLDTTTIDLTYVASPPRTLEANVNDASIAVVKLANGVDGELITWDAAGVATTVPVGTATHVLTSNGVGLPPTFQAPAPGGVVESVISPAAIASSQNNYAPAGWSAATHARISATAANFSITGFDDAATVTTKRVINVGGTHAITLLNANVGSAAENRMLLPGGIDYVLNIGATVDLWYDPTSARWRLVSDSENEVWEHAQAMSDYEDTDLTLGKKAYYRIKRPVLLTQAFITINPDFLPAGATLLAVDVLRNGVSLLSTQLTIDAGESSSHTAAIPFVFTGGGNPPVLTAADLLEFEVTAVPNTTNTRGLVATLIGIPV